MDPVMELATVTVSYLWVWRELFPEAAAFPHRTPDGGAIGDVETPVDAPPTVDTPPTVDASATVDAKTIVARVAGDYSLLARLHDLSVRAPEERWSVDSTTRAVTREKTDIDDIMLEAADSVEARPDDWRLVALARRSTRQFRKLESEKIDTEMQLMMARNYARHISALAGVFENLTVPVRQSERGTDVTRESVTSTVAHLLFERSLLSQVAIALDHRPILMRHDPNVGAKALDDPEYPQQLLKHCIDRNEAIPFDFVLHEELQEITRSRPARYKAVYGLHVGDEPEVAGGELPGPDEVNDDPVPAPDTPRRLPADRGGEMELLGLCFSGGGIRSATFNLGILQALANRGWLPRVDYLSTVSGGGYIGAWFLAWIKRRGSVVSVQESLRGLESRSQEHRRRPFRNPDPADPHVRPIRFLREYSNYLAPTAGFFTADTWTMVSTWLRNTALNLLVLAFSLMALLIAPRLMAYLPLAFQTPFWPAAIAVALVLSASLLIGINLRSFEVATQHTNATNPARGDSTLVIALTIVLPMFLAGAFATAALWTYPPDPGVGLAVAEQRSSGFVGQLQAIWRQLTDGLWSRVFVVSALCCLAGLFLTVLVSNWGARGIRERRGFEQELLQRLGRAVWRSVRAFAFSAALAAALGGSLTVLISQQLVPLLWEDTQRGVWISVAFGPLVVLLVLACVIILYVGLEGNRFPDERREWWSRLGALIGLSAAGWALVACISFFAPLWVARLGLYANAAGLGWVAITVAGARLASSGRSNGNNLSLDRKPLSAALIQIAPFVFVLGFLVLLSVGAHALLGALQARRVLVSPDFTVFDLPPFELERYVETYWALLEPRSIAPLIVAFVLCVAAALLAWRVDVNEFSMHHFYRNRLVRAYLGASRSPRHRWPNAFTGFDLDDDIKLWRFTTADRSAKNDTSSDCRNGFVGPYPIINAALNTSGGEDLAWQERKARSFVFTPLYCGFDFSSRQPALPDRVQTQFAYRPTTGFGSTGDDPGLGIGTTIAISGAAANPNAGFHTSPAVAFLLTVFNARLGWWMGNPRSRRWNKASPTFGLFYLLSELLGFANTSRKYVNLSDGGHFDNLGVYELVRRRCMYIVVCDAEQDLTYSLQGLANTIRKCRVDFGVVIAFDPGAIEAVAPDPVTKLSPSHMAVGRILYPGISQQGRILYLKSSIGGHDEPPDVLEYRRRFPDFPHQSTADQFFDESQFESYRALGQHVGELLPNLRWRTEGEGPEALAALFDRAATRNSVRLGRLA